MIINKYNCIFDNQNLTKETYMLFSSALFLFIFLPIVLITYYLTPKSYRNFLLLLVSLFFYTFGETKYVFLIIASILVDYTAGLIIEKGWRKTGLILSLIVNISFLLYFKYTNFLFGNYHEILKFFNVPLKNAQQLPKIVLPLGISFFTFQTMSYTIDVYRRKVKANKNLIDFATYVSLFPQLIAGPIVRYKDVYKQLTTRTENLAQFKEGTIRFMLGLGKKMIIANNMAIVADAAFKTTNTQLTSTIAWLGIITYTLQIYFDFSGYSDMAIGLGKMFGFDFPENFNFPYISKSIKEFWRRWHISLSNWFKDYLYISLGGNRNGIFRTYINLLIVFLITGLWHGAGWNFIIWGLIHGFFLIFERLGLLNYLKKFPSLIMHIYTMSVVIIAWVFFRADNISKAWLYLKKMFQFKFSEDLHFTSLYITHEFLITFILALIFAFNIEKLFRQEIINSYAYQLSRSVFAFIVFFISIIYIAIDTYNPFIYFRF